MPNPPGSTPWDQAGSARSGPTPRPLAEDQELGPTRCKHAEAATRHWRRGGARDKGAVAGEVWRRIPEDGPVAFATSGPVSTAPTPVGPRQVWDGFGLWLAFRRPTQDPRGRSATSRGQPVPVRCPTGDGGLVGRAQVPRRWRRPATVAPTGGGACIGSGGAGPSRVCAPPGTPRDAQKADLGHVVALGLGRWARPRVPGWCRDAGRRGGRVVSDKVGSLTFT